MPAASGTGTVAGPARHAGDRQVASDRTRRDCPGPLDFAADFAITIPANRDYWRVYAAGTHENFVGRGPQPQPGMYTFRLTPPAPPWRPGATRRPSVVSTTNGNHSTQRLSFRVSRAARSLKRAARRSSCPRWWWRAWLKQHLARRQGWCATADPGKSDDAAPVVPECVRMRQLVSHVSGDRVTGGSRELKRATEHLRPPSTSRLETREPPTEPDSRRLRTACPTECPPPASKMMTGRALRVRVRNLRRRPAYRPHDLGPCRMVQR